MKTKLKLWSGALALLFMLGTQPAFSQQARKISMKEAIDLAVANSHSIQNNKARIDEATAAIREAKEARLPDLSVSASYLYLPVQPTVMMKSDSNAKEFASPHVSQAVYGIANATLPIYTGGKLKYGIESAKFLDEAVRLDAEHNKEAVILNAINAFANLYKAGETVALVKENLAQANQRVKDFSNLEKNGLLARNDLLKAELQSSNVELTLLDAENNRKLASVNMALMLGLPEQTSLLPDSASFQPPSHLNSLDEYEQLAMMERKDAGALAARKKAAEIGVKSVAAEHFPDLALTGGYIAADIPGMMNITNALNVGVGLRYNLSSFWKTKSKREGAEARVRQVVANQQQLTDDIRLQVNKAFQNFLLSQKKIEVYRKAGEQASENYRITRNKYDNSLATTTDLLDADVAQLQTRINLANAGAELVVAYNQLLQTAGTLNNE